MKSLTVLLPVRNGGWICGLLSRWKLGITSATPTNVLKSGDIYPIEVIRIQQGTLNEGFSDRFRSKFRSTHSFCIGGDQKWPVIPVNWEQETETNVSKSSQQTGKTLPVEMSLNLSCYIHHLHISGLKCWVFHGEEDICLRQFNPFSII